MSNLITRAMSDRSASDGSSCQAVWLSGRVTPDMEILQGQGLHFRAPKGSDGVAVAPGGIAESAVMLGLGARRTLPEDDLVEGEGGLHLLGEFKVFLAEDGTVCLGSKDPADFVALASLVLSELQRVKADFNSFKTAYDAHTHLVGPPVSAPSGPPEPTWVAGPSDPSSVASEVVKTD